MNFGKGFKWGIATAAYQIEGAADIDGKGPSVWDMKCRMPGAIFNGHTGDVACDHYHRYKEDVRVMKEIGVQTYRMSISWPRILPEGIGEINSQGIDFYSRLIDELLENDIEPYITLFHWDYPQSLFLKGGCLNPESPDWFAGYTKVVVDALSDRVKNWITLNEPQCFIGLGHYLTEHAPGISLAFSEVLRCCHNVLLSHGRAVQVIRNHAKQDAVVGYAPVGDIYVPCDENSVNDIDFARYKTFDLKSGDCFNSALWMDPVILGKYPEKCAEVYGSDMPDYDDGDMSIISEPIDFLGLNIYFAKQVSSDDTGQGRSMPRNRGHVYTPMGWPIEPKSMYWGPKFFYERYKKPIMITENGMANIDLIGSDGKIHDPQRIEFLRRYISKLQDACADGVDVQGYFLWSLLDNFEWAHGYSKRFGLVHVDYETQKRTIKDSGYWYKKIIETNGDGLMIGQ